MSNLDYLDTIENDMDAPSMNSEALSLLRNDRNINSTKKAFNLFKEAANLGNTEAQANLAGCYLAGLGTPKYEKEGVKWAFKASENTSPLAHFLLGYCYEKGIVVSRNIDTAFNYFLKSSELGNVDSIKKVNNSKYKDYLIRHNQSKKNKDYFDIIIFDLDNTLLSTDHLESFRGIKNLEDWPHSRKLSLLEKLKFCKILIDQSVIVNWQKKYPKTFFCILTRAPKEYAKVILDNLYHQVRWDSIVAYEDVNGDVKPRPTGVNKLINQFKIIDKKRALIIGDHSSDIICAHQSGIRAAVFKHWSYGDKDRWKCQNFMPDIITNDYKTLEDYFDNIYKFTHPLESWANGTEAPLSSVREIRKFNNFENDKSIVVNVLGRYFSSSNIWYNYRKSIEQNPLNKDIIKLKNNNIEDYIVNCITKILQNYIEKDINRDKDWIITCIPSKSNNRTHMDYLIYLINKAWSSPCNILFKTDVLSFLKNAISNKELNREERYKNIKNNMIINNPQVIQRKHVLIIDDVVTTGSTLFRAHQLIKEAKASSVATFSLTSTI